jgi:predicted GIY-YIG superfamily endonuclease
MGADVKRCLAVETKYYAHNETTISYPSYTTVACWEKPGAVRGTVYVLELKNDCYYIGWTTNLRKRLAKHFQGKAANWTKLHRALRLLETYENATLRMEDEVTERYLEKYGQEKVRGGQYVIEKYDPNCIPASLREARRQGLLKGDTRSPNISLLF